MFYGCYIASVYKSMAISVPEEDDQILTMAGSFGSACNGLSRIMWASLQDKFEFKKIYFCLLTL